MIFPAEAELQLMAAEESEDSTGDYGEAVTEAVTELGLEMVTSPSPAAPDTRPVHGRPMQWSNQCKESKTLLHLKLTLLSGLK